MASAGWERRNARARAAGYRNYYDFRAHDNGRLPPSAPALRGELLARSRGHRGASDLQKAVDAGRVSMAQVYDTTKDSSGKVTHVSMLVTDQRGNQRLYRVAVGRMSVEQLEHLQASLDAQGVDVREYTRKVKVEDIFEEEDIAATVAAASQEAELVEEGELEAEGEDEFPF